MKFKLTLTREFEGTDYFAKSMVNDVGEVPVDITDDEATSAVRDAFMAGYIDADDILDPEYADWRVTVLGEGEFAPILQLYIEGNAVQAEVGMTDDSIALFGRTDTERIIMSVSPEQLLVWAAQLRIVADRCDELAAMVQPSVCFPTAGMVANDGHN